MKNITQNKRITLVSLYIYNYIIAYAIMLQLQHDD
jgi:hypothetical protein